MFEQETTITFDNATKTASVFTYDTRLIKRIRDLDRDELKIIKDNGDHIICEVPKKWVKITPPRIMSETEKEQRRQIMRNVLDQRRADSI